ncbi:hypothetical protein [Listeria sp. PSOL-1]|uniref:hypothetical protein n=1 Tax=Listeria sp. PSOL-1 TaxID=1844999 RepID=UPI0013D2BAC8|nr:hypothetical protein [Listeria sp. PSOL-1]
MDISAFYYENNTIRLFCYGENKSSYDKFYVDYNLITHQIITYPMPNYNIEGVCSADGNCYLLTNGHILATDKAMNEKMERLIDEQVYTNVSKVSSAFTEIMMESDTYFYILNSRDFKETGKVRK